MGVYIKGMEMPTSCYGCSFAVEAYEGSGVYDCVVTDSRVCKGAGRRDDCPLVPVPPHGRLVDADALYSRIKDEQRKCNDPYDGWSECQVALGFVNTAPTIIPAEEGET